MSGAAQPLAGLRVAVTRPRDDARELADLLEHAGASTVTVPLTRIVPPSDDTPLQRGVARLEQYDWVILTSVQAVRAVAAWTRICSVSVRIAAVGPATAAAVRALLDREADVVPPQFTAGALVPAILERGPLRGARVLWPRAERAGDDLRRALAEAGAVLDDPVAYRTVPDHSAAATLAAMIRRGEIDVVTFTAPSAVVCYAREASGSALCTIAVIGPSTAAAAHECGLPVHVVPEQPIISALVTALVRFIEGDSLHNPR